MVVRRSRLIVAVVVLALVVGAVLLVDRVVYSYQPLTFTNGGSSGGFGTAHATIDAPEYRGATLYRFEPGGFMQFGATLSNVGSRSVRVTGFPRSDHAYMRPAEIDLMPIDLPGGMTGPWSPFEAFTLGGASGSCDP